ncbi:MAG: phosphatidate cytidylyltransferase [Verrucomicrobiota bacterium]
MGKRIFSTVLLWSILIAVVWFFRNNGALVLIALTSVFTLREFYQLMRASGYAPFDKVGLLLGGLITLAPWLQVQFGWPAAYLLLPLATIVFSVRLLGERTPQNRVEALGTTLFGLVYVSVMMAFLVAIVTPLPGDTLTPNARLLLCLWLIATAKFCDVGALLTGMAIGKHRMSPVISPKKTWEGAFGGIAVSMGIGALIAWLARDSFPSHMTPLIAALMAAPIAALGIVADLVESVIKRRANMKDSGATFPGIGGMFDLCDSLLLTAPVAYVFFGFAR